MAKSKKKPAARKHAKHKHLVLRKTSSGKSRWVKPNGGDKKPKAKSKKSREKAGIMSSFNPLKGGGHEHHSPSDGSAYVQRQRAAIAKLRKEGKHDEATKKEAILRKFLTQAHGGKK